jgi:ribosomal protein L37AE/L43A
MRRCEHGVYWPEGHAIAFCCEFCNPLGNPGQASPTFNRRGSLALTTTGKLPKCPNCQGNSILTVSNGGKCTICKTEFDLTAPTKLRANNRQPGVCPECGSGVHFQVSNKEWKCADCDTTYRAPKRLA